MMKRWGLMVAASVALFASAAAIAWAATGDAAEKAAGDSADIIAIKAVERGFAEALSVKDAAKYYAPDVVVMDVFTPGFYRSAAAAKKDMAWQFAQMKSINSTFTELNIMQHGNLACAASLQRAIVPLKNGKTVDVSFPFTDVLQKINGKWKIVIQHSSFPLDPETLNSAADKPLSPTKFTRRENLAPDDPVPVEQAKAEIKEAIFAQLAAQTPAGEMPLYEPDDDFTVFDSFLPSTYRGYSQTISAFKESMKDIKSLKIAAREFGVVTDGAFGAAYTLQDIDIDQKDGTTRKLNVRQLDCLHRRDGKWYSIHEHNSFPIDQKSWSGVLLLQYADAAKP